MIEEFPFWLSQDFLLYSLPIRAKQRQARHEGSIAFVLKSHISAILKTSLLLSRKEFHEA